MAHAKGSQTSSRVNWKKRAQDLQQANNQLSQQYEEMLLQYTTCYEEAHKYKKFESLYHQLQTENTLLKDSLHKLSDSYLLSDHDSSSSSSSSSLSSPSSFAPSRKKIYQHALKVPNYKIAYDHNNAIDSYHQHIQTYPHTHDQSNEHTYKSKYDHLSRQHEQLQSEHLSLQTIVQTLQKENEENQVVIEQLKKDLSTAQRDILEMTNIVGVKQALPTVQETLSLFHSIRDQQHHNTCTKLKVYVKRTVSSKYQKYYLNQIVHELMYKTLVECNRVVISQRQQMFVQIAEKLNMDYTLKKVYASSAVIGHGGRGYEVDLDEMHMDMDVSDEEDEKYVDQAFIDGERDKILANRFGSYFRENYQFILKKNELKEKVERKVLSECGEFGALLMGGREAEDVMEAYREYVVQCIEVCWIMLLQDPVLEMQPMRWRPDGRVLYEENVMKRVLGSDRKCDYVLYYVWPILVRNGSVLKDQKQEVVTKEELYTPKKRKN